MVIKASPAKSVNKMIGEKAKEVFLAARAQMVKYKNHGSVWDFHLCYIFHE